MGVGAGVRNFTDLKPEASELMRLIAKVQMGLFGTAEGEDAFDAQIDEFEELVARPMDSNQLFVSIYLGEEGDEIFREANCVSVDPNCVNIAVPPPDSSAIAGLLLSTAFRNMIDPFGLAAVLPGALAFQRQLLDSPLVRFWMAQGLALMRAATVLTPQTNVHPHGLAISGFVPQKLPINHALVGFDDATRTAAREGLKALLAWPD
jgi:hypothetical protein